MKTVYLTKLPSCCLCQTPARFNSPVNQSSWGYLCDGHMALHGSMGFASRLSDEEEPEVNPTDKRHLIMAAINDGNFDEVEDLVGDGDISEWI